MPVAAHHTRYVSIRKEAYTDYNNPTAGTAPTFVGEVESESFGMNYDILKRSDMNYYGARAAVTSIESSEGSISLALQPDAFTLCALHGIMGVHTPGAAYTDIGTITEALVTSTTRLPHYSFFIGRDEKQHVFAGQVIDSISVSASVGEYAMLTINTVGAAQNSSTGTLATNVPTYTGDAAHFAKAYVNFGAAADSSSAFSNLVQSISFDVSTNRDTDNTYGLAATTCLRPPVPTTREITGSLTFHKSLLSGDVASEPYYDELMGATGREVNPGSGAPALSVLFAVDASNYLRFDFFNIIYEMAQTSVSGRDVQTMTVNFHALYDAADANAMMQITYKTTDSSMDSGGTPIDFD